MLHEIKKCIEAAQKAQELGQKTVLVSVVFLEGSSYRRPGVKMLLLENGNMVGAVSGGCVEKEIQVQAQSVFKDGISKLMMYDGRYRLGCEGQLYLLLELFSPSAKFLDVFRKETSSRNIIEFHSYYSREEKYRLRGGTQLKTKEGVVIPLSQSFDTTLVSNKELDCYIQKVSPGFKLVLIGAEHDTVELVKFASLAGWEVTVVVALDEAKSIENFPGATFFYSIDETQLSTVVIDQQTAVLLMTHSFVKDLKYLSALQEYKLAYIGILGPAKRREKLLSKLIEFHPEVPDSLFNCIYGPSGINIGAETPQEIAISIMAEILSVIRNQTPMPLKEKREGIHD